MAWYERDYYREDYARRPVIGRLRLLSVTTWLIIINIAVFVLDSILAAVTGYLPLATWGHFSAWTAIYHLQVWRFITFQFLHGDEMHLLFNMLAIYFFGPMIESHFGPRRFIGFYLLCGVAGAALYLVLWQFGLLRTYADTPMVGASAGIFGILIAAARIAPNAQVQLLFPPIPVRLKVLAWVFVGIAALTILRRGANAGGQAAHLGGALAGYLLIQWDGILNIFEGRLPWRRRPKMRYRG